MGLLQRQSRWLDLRGEVIRLDPSLTLMISVAEDQPLSCGVRVRCSASSQAINSKRSSCSASHHPCMSELHINAGLDGLASFFLLTTNKIDMTKSYAPRMHSAEHILNQAMVRKFDCGRCFSAHVNKKKSKCDYHFDRALTDDETKEVEEAVNEAISSGLEVTEEMASREDASRDFNLTRLPDGTETVRIVHIGDYDSCPCIGEHVDNTSEIGRFRIISQDVNEGVLRLRYKLDDPE